MFFLSGDTNLTLRPVLVALSCLLFAWQLWVGGEKLLHRISPRTWLTLKQQMLSSSSSSSNSNSNSDSNSNSGSSSSSSSSSTQPRGGVDVNANANANEGVWEKRQMDHARAQLAKKAFQVLEAISIPILLAVTVSVCWQPRHSGLPSLFLFLVQLVFASQTACVAAGVSHSHAHLRVFCIFFYSCWILGVWVVWTAHPHMCSKQNIETLARVLLGLMLMDSKLSAVLNIILSASFICRRYALEQDAAYAIFELTTLLGMHFLFHVAEHCVKTHVSVSSSEAVATSLQQALKQLLSVLCDAEVCLTPDLRISEPSPKLCELLAPGRPPSELDGLLFTDLVDKADLERWLLFLSADGPPTSLQLQLQLPTAASDCDGDGKGNKGNKGNSSSNPVSVALFHSPLPDLGPERVAGGHLVGIKDLGSLREASALAEPQGPTFGPGFPVRAGAEARRSSRGSGSWSSSSVCSRVRGTRLKEMESCELSFDPLDPDMPVRELRCTFRSGGIDSDPGDDNDDRRRHATRGGKSAARAAVPQQTLTPLTSWFHAHLKKRLTDWVQENCNTYIFGGNTNYTNFGCNGVLKWPGSGNPRQKDTRMLLASDLSIRFESHVAVPDSDANIIEDSEDEDTEVVAVIRLSGFESLAISHGWHQPIEE